MVDTVDGRRHDIEQRARLFAALADPTRLRIVEQFRESRELSGSEVAEGAGISLALACHHLKVLTDAGLLSRRKAGQTTYYTIIRGTIDAALRSLTVESQS